MQSHPSYPALSVYLKKYPTAAASLFQAYNDITYAQQWEEVTIVDLGDEYQRAAIRGRRKMGPEDGGGISEDFSYVFPYYETSSRCSASTRCSWPSPRKMLQLSTTKLARGLSSPLYECNYSLSSLTVGEEACNLYVPMNYAHKAAASFGCAFLLDQVLPASHTALLMTPGEHNRSCLSLRQ